MDNFMTLFIGGNIVDILKQQYYSDLDVEVVDDLAQKVFKSYPVYQLDSTIHPDSVELTSARHLASLFLLKYVIFKVTNKHTRKSFKSTIPNIVMWLREEGIIVTEDQYHNWFRKKNSREICQPIIDKMLEYVNLSPNEFKQITYFYVLAERKAKEEDGIFTKILEFIHINSTYIKLIINSKRYSYRLFS